MRSSLKRLTIAAASAAAVFSAVAQADLAYPPATSAGHDFNHAPIGQSFTAIAADVRAGVYLADETSFTDWLATVYPGQILPGSFPYPVAPSVSVRIDLFAGEDLGTLLHSTTRTLTAPFSDFVDVDYGAAGIQLTAGARYTLLLTDISNQTYPYGVTGWVVPAVDYPDGHPVLQGALIIDDAGIGDSAFHVLDNVPTPPVETVSGTNAVITAYVARNPGFIVVNGGLNLNDHLWTTELNPSNTTFLGGLVNWFQTGLLVDYTGIVSGQGVILTQLTVKPAPTPIVISLNLPAGTVGEPYAGQVGISGGVAPYSVAAGGLPAGLAFDGANFSGTPLAAGTSAVTVLVTDALGVTAQLSADLVINAPPPPPTSAYTVKDEGKGRITSVGSGFIMVGTKKLIWNAASRICVNTPDGERSVVDSFVTAGLRVQWKGLRDPKTNTVLTSKLEIN